MQAFYQIQQVPPEQFLEKIQLFMQINRDQTTAASTWWCGAQTYLGWIKVAVGLSGNFSHPIIFSLCCPLNGRGRAVFSLFKIGRFSFLLLGLFLPRILILILFMMSSGIHPNLGRVFPCSICAGNVTWRGRSVQCCTCFQWTI